MQVGFGGHGAQRDVIVAGGPAQVSGICEGRARRLAVPGGLVGLRQSNGGEGTRVQIVLGQECEGAPSVLDCSERIPQTAVVQGPHGRGDRQQMLGVIPVHSRTRLRGGAFAQSAVGFSQKVFDAIQTADQHERSGVPDRQ